MTQLTEMVEPVRPLVDDLDSSFEEKGRPWVGCLGWALTLGFVLFPFGIIAHDAIKAAREDAQFRRDMAAEKAEMRRLVKELARGNAEQQRLAKEIRTELEKGGTR